MLTAIGLFLDIIGFILILLFNPAMNMAKEHIKTYVEKKESTLTIPSYSELEARKIKNSLRLYNLGVWLIILGFLLQFVNSICNT